MSKLVSVILPIYNREEYIEESLNSALSQSYQNFEIVIVDDGSTDSSYEICEKYAQKDKRIRLFKNSHQGVSEARNTAIDNAKGDYVFFLDSDDVIHPELLNNLVNAVCQTGAKIAGTSVFSILEEKWDTVREVIEADNKEAIVEYKEFSEALSIMLSGGSPINLAGGTMLEKALIADTRFRKDLFIAEDFYFVYENLIKGANVAYIKPQRYYNRIHSKNSSWVYDFSGFFTRFERRRLVWQNEAKCGRMENSYKQRKAAFATFSQCAGKHKKADSEVLKMAEVLRKYKKEILEALPFKSKIFFYLYAFMPFTYFWIKNIKK